MISQPQANRSYTPDEYLQIDANSTERHEYVAGEIVLMTGGTPNHNQIALNLGGALNVTLRQQPYRVFVLDQRLWIPKRQIYTYPDIIVVQGELQFQTGRRDTITNPIAIVEVLSNSTKAYDQGDKFKAYRTIPGFQEYLLIDQYSQHVEHYFRTQPRTWTFTEYDGEETILRLSSFAFEISLLDLYSKVEFERTENRETQS